MGACNRVRRLDNRVRPRSHRSLPQRCVGWTNNLLASGFVVVAALGFGRQVIHWWQAPLVLTSGGGAGANRSADSRMLADPRSPHLLEFGDLPLRLGRRSFSGPRSAVLAALRAECRGVLARSAATTGGLRSAELEFLHEVRALPAVEQADTWRMYELDQPLPLVVLVREPDPTRASPECVGAFGMALLADEESQHWTLLTLEPRRGAAGTSTVLATVPPPSGGARIMYLESAGGEGLLAFTGTGRMEEWSVFFRQWFQSRGWSAAGPEAVSATGSCRLRHAVDGSEVDILLGDAGRLNAVIVLSPLTDAL